MGKKTNTNEAKQLEQAIDVTIGLLDDESILACPLVRDELSRLELSFHRRLREINQTKSKRALKKPAGAVGGVTNP